MSEPAIPFPLTRQPGARLALTGLGAILALVLIGPLVWTTDPHQIASDPAQMLRMRNLGPSLAHPLGTDQLGRDQLARLMLGGRISLAVGLVAMLVSLGLGTLIGASAGYFRRLDGVLMRLTNLFLALPVLPFLLLMMTLFRDPLANAMGAASGSFVLVVLSIGVTAWMPTALLVRAEVRALREQDFIRAARAIGASDIHILRRHILPNALTPILIAGSLGLTSAMLTESTLSFLGLGFPPDTPTWGRLLHEGVGAMRSDPARLFWPGLALSLTLLCVSTLAEALRRALTPRQG